jgi:hypothetical protein
MGGVKMAEKGGSFFTFPYKDIKMLSEVISALCS